MDQLHKRFNTEQVKMLFQRYNTGDMSRAEIQEILGLGKTRFFALLKGFKMMRMVLRSITSVSQDLV